MFISINSLKKNYIKILFIFFISVFIDYFLFIKHSPPAWDQGYHLSNLFKTYNILNNDYLNFFKKLDEILNVSETYRGPLTYFLSALFLKVFGNSYKSAYLSNHLFNLIAIFSIFNLGIIIKNQRTGILAIILFTFSPLIIIQRSDYLIDFSLLAFSTLNILFLTRWFLNENKFSFLSIFCGINLGLVFLVKPTGIILFIMPILYIFIKRLLKNGFEIFFLSEVFIYFTLFFLTIIPWFSRNWLTIISSIINAWKWGINYQDGLDFNSILGWLFYINNFPKAFGIINLSTILAIYIIFKFKNKNSNHSKIHTLSDKDIWFSIIFINFYLISSLMSTKDIRFLMPIFPLICLFIAKVIDNNIINKNQHKVKQTALVISILYTILTLHLKGENIGSLENLQGRASLNNWPHKEIIEEINTFNPEFLKTLAVMPDTKEINTFNLEAEAIRQKEHVAVRQIVSNKKSYKDDLKYFDWFLLKTKDQGIMKKDSNDLLKDYLLSNSSFIKQKEWLLPDNSKVILLRRVSLNSNIKKINCESKKPIVLVEKTSNGIKIIFKGRGHLARSSNLLIDFYRNNKRFEENISLAQGLFQYEFDENKCYEIIQNLPTDNYFFDNFEKVFYETNILSNNQIFRLAEKEVLQSDQSLSNGEYILMANKINKLNDLGILLKLGRFEQLFDLIGILNQSDPKQIYLENGEIIYSQRFIKNNRVDDLYNILIAQLLQRKVDHAEKTITKILEIDKLNTNSFIVKSIINIYLFNIKESRQALMQARLLANSNQNITLIDNIESILDILELKFIKVYNKLLR